jgi:hypothetical protein
VELEILPAIVVDIADAALGASRKCDDILNLFSFDILNAAKEKNN